jgi:hypothetical protein
VAAGRSTDAMLEAKRTLVKSGPELWAEVSDPGALARHLAPFGSVRIVRTEPETLVAWEGEKAAGVVALEESGFGTRVVMTAAIVGAAPPAAPEPEPAPEPAPELEAEPEPEPEPERRGFWARLFRRRAPEPAPAPPAPPAPAAAPPPEPEPVAGPPAMTDEAALLVLTDTLDALGKAHHRPFSRA